MSRSNNISENVDRMELLTRLLNNKNINTAKSTKIQKRNISSPVSLTYAQKRLWFLDKFETNKSAYNISCAVRIIGSLRTDLLEKSINHIIARHEILHTRFDIYDGDSVQIIEPLFVYKIKLVDLSGSFFNQNSQAVNEIINVELNHKFDLTMLPLFKFTLIKLSQEEHILLFIMHHIISDGWSIGIFFEEIAHIYDSYSHGADCTLPYPVIQYGDFANWQKSWTVNNILNRDHDYWTEKLSGASFILDMPSDHPRPAIKTNNGALHYFHISKQVSEGLDALSNKQGATIFMTLLTVFNILIYRYTGQQDILIGTPIACRDLVEIEGLIGLFVNTIIIRTVLHDNINFSDLLEEVSKTCIEAYSHQNYPFEELVKELHPHRDMSYSPLFQVMFMMESPDALNKTIGGLQFIPYDIDSHSSQFDISLSVKKNNGAYSCSFEYNTDLFTQDYIVKLESHYQTLLQSVVNNPQKRISQFDLLTGSELDLIHNKWNNTTASFEKNCCISRLFENKVELSPNSISVICNQEQLTYAELNEKSNQLAHFLQLHGVREEKTVGILLDCSCDMIVSILGILKVGGAYVPLDPSYPDSRLEFIQNDSAFDVLITQKDFEREIFSKISKVIYIDNDKDAIASESSENIDYVIKGNNLACVIYTSGTSGIPKGVMLEMKGIVNLINSFIKSYDVSPRDRVLPLTSITSASFVGEILPIICAGGAVVLSKKNEYLDFEKLANMIIDNGVTIISTVPSMITKLNSYLDVLGQIRLILSGGESLNSGEINKLIKSTTVVNGYGLTETTICSTYHFVKENDIANRNGIPIGFPIMNTKIYIMDKALNLMPIGCKGEIYIGGSGLARGYLNNDQLSKERFIQNPFAPGERLYKTGDIGKWKADGNIEYYGRSDNQVKIRGFRVELSEIESVMSLYDDINETIAVIYDDNNQNCIVAYFVSKSGNELAIQPLREWLRTILPEYMIPSYFTQLAQIPVGGNGKIDKKLLPKIDNITKSNTSTEEPQNEVERVIKDIWKEFLRIDQIDVNDNFFDIGGHSLMIAQVYEKLKDIYAQKINMVIMFQYPTIRSLAQYLNQKESQSDFESVHKRAHKQREMLNKRRKLLDNMR